MFRKKEKRKEGRKERRKERETKKGVHRTSNVWGSDKEEGEKDFSPRDKITLKGVSCKRVQTACLRLWPAFAQPFSHVP